jgi:hypothetical protein
MDERFRLVFRGEILEGQHRAVVKRRLTDLLKLSEAQLDKLFSGNPVTIKRDADRATAVRYQTLFKEAGGRLRVLAAAQASENSRGVAAASGSSAATAPEASGKTAPADAAGEGSLTVVTAYFPPSAEPRPEIVAPDFDVAAVGADLTDAVEAASVAVPDPDFDVAEVGADLLIAKPAEVVTQVRDVSFEVMEAGATLGVEADGPEPEAPDVSHIRLVEP